MSPLTAPDGNSNRPTASHAWTLRPRLLGVALPFLVSLPCSWIDPSLLMIGVIPLLVGALSGAVIRSWWAPSATPIALILGSLPSIAFRQGGFTDMTRPSLLAGASVYAVLALLPLTLGTLIGVPLGKQLARPDLTSDPATAATPSAPA